MATTANETRYSAMIRECGVSKAFEYFLTEQAAAAEFLGDGPSANYLERCMDVMAFIATVYGVEFERVVLSHTTFHIKPVKGDKPLWTCCRRYLAQE